MYCTNPLIVNIPNDKQHRWLVVPCGHCGLCQNRRKSDLVFRLRQTGKHSINTYFVTLTYRREELPPYGTNGKDELQKFLKRIRFNYKLKEYGFKYYAIIELGGDKGRIHHHLIMFNTPWETPEEASVAIKKTWNKGIVDVKPIHDNRYKYVAKYTFQNMYKPKKVSVENVDEDTGEVTTKWVKPVNYFQAFSSQGIGIEYLTPEMLNYLRERGDGLMVADGVELPLPRYYFDKVFPEGSIQRKLLKERRYDFIDEQKWEEMDYMRSLRVIKDSDKSGRDNCYHIQEAEENIEKERKIKEHNKKYRFLEPPKEAWIPKELNL